MKAAWRERYGTGEVLQVREADKPVPGDNDILIRVHGTTVNRTDCANLTGKPWIMRLFQGLFRPNNPIPGTDFTGEVIGVGKNVTHTETGKRIWGFRDAGIASQAEYMVVSDKVPVHAAPASLALFEAVACLEGAHYALNFLNKVRLKSGQNAIVNGGTGAIGSAMIQLLVVKGINVTATARGEHAEKVLNLGASHVIDYTKEDFTNLTGTYDYVFDAVGKSTFGKCRHLLKPRGVYISSEFGPYGQNAFLALFTPLFKRKKVLFPFPADVAHTLKYMHELVENGQFTPLIDRTFRLDEIGDAYDYVLTGTKIGNVVIHLNHE